MKRIGLVGGTGPESTKEYYMELVRKAPGFDNPEIIIYSVNMHGIIEKQEEGGWEAAGEEFIKVVDSLEAAGADFATICANTPHIVYDQVNEATNLPMISIIDAVVAKGVALGVKKPLLLGTKWIMKADLYPKAFEKEGIEVVVPERRDLAAVNRYIFNELEKGILLPETRKWFLDLIEGYRENGADSVILGCTEIPLLITQEDLDIPALDTMQIHIDAIFDYANS